MGRKSPHSQPLPHHLLDMLLPIRASLARTTTLDLVAMYHPSRLVSDLVSSFYGLDLEEKKQNVVSKPAVVTKVNAGGIQMASDGLSAEQLEQLQKIMQVVDSLSTSTNYVK